MAEEPFRHQNWDDVLDRLKHGQIPSGQIGHAIVKLAKPFDEARILTAKNTIALYLDHNDSWVRHEAMWFLTSWGRLREYQPALIRALRTDPDLDNRSFAATCLARLCQGTNDAEVIAALKTTVKDDDLEQLVRLYAYGALLSGCKGYIRRWIFASRTQTVRRRLGMGQFALGCPLSWRKIPIALKIPLCSSKRVNA